MLLSALTTAEQAVVSMISVIDALAVVDRDEHREACCSVLVDIMVQPFCIIGHTVRFHTFPWLQARSRFYHVTEGRRGPHDCRCPPRGQGNLLWA